MDTQVVLIDVQYTQKAVFSFEKCWNCQNHSSSGSIQPVKYSSSKISDSPQPLTAIWKILIYKTLWLPFVHGVQLPQGYTEPLWGDSLLFTINSWYSLNQSRKDERLRWPWNHPVVLNLFINLVNTQEFLVSSGRLIKNMFPLHICRPKIIQ